MAVPKPKRKTAATPAKGRAGSDKPMPPSEDKDIRRWKMIGVRKNLRGPTAQSYKGPRTTSAGPERTVRQSDWSVTKTKYKRKSPPGTTRSSGKSSGTR